MTLQEVLDGIETERGAMIRRWGQGVNGGPWPKGKCHTGD
jgi:hypothetical protein